jgi:hypothetical protein
VTRGRLQATHVERATSSNTRRVLEGGKHPDCRDGTPLRGGSRDGDLDRRVMRKAPTFRAHAAPMTMGCSTRKGGGEPLDALSRLAARGTRVPSLLANRPTHTLRHRLNHPRRNRRWTRGVASHAASRGAVTFGALPPGRLALAREDGIDGVVWLAACLSSEEGGLSHAARVERSAREAEANASERAETPSRRGERGLDARGRARASLMLLQKSTDSVRRREADALHFTRFGSVQGRAPSSRPHVREYVAAGEETLAPTIEAETSRDRFRGGCARAWRGGLAMEGILDRRGRRIFTDRLQSTVLADSADLTLRVSEREPRGGDRGARGTVGLGSARKNNAACEPEAARRSESGVVKRWVPQSPSSRAQALGRRGETQVSKRCWERTRRECS